MAANVACMALAASILQLPPMEQANIVKRLAKGDSILQQKNIVQRKADCVHFTRPAKRTHYHIPY